MKFETQKGDVLDLTAPYDIAASTTFNPGFKVGSIIGVTSSAANGTTFEGHVTGLHVVAKATGAAWSQGDTLYWDDTAKNFTKTSSGNTKAGYAALAAASGDAIGSIRLVPSI
jgi:predicted RecA/RadA family phage recombinase